MGLDVRHICQIHTIDGRVGSTMSPMTNYWELSGSTACGVAGEDLHGSDCVR